MINIRMKGHFVRNFSSFKAGLPISSAPSFLHLRFSFRLPSCAFWNYIYLLTYTSMLDRQTDERVDTSRQRVSRTISRAKMVIKRLIGRLTVLLSARFRWKLGGTSLRRRDVTAITWPSHLWRHLSCVVWDRRLSEPPTPVRSSKRLYCSLLP